MALQTTVVEGPKLAAADLPQLASVTHEAAMDGAEPVAEPGQFTAPGVAAASGPGDARHEAATAMLLLFVATVRSKRERDGNAQQAAAAERPARPAGQQTADAGQVR